MHHAKFVWHGELRLIVHDHQIFVAAAYLILLSAFIVVAKLVRKMRGHSTISFNVVNTSIEVLIISFLLYSKNSPAWTVLITWVLFKRKRFTLAKFSFKSGFLEDRDKLYRMQVSLLPQYGEGDSASCREIHSAWHSPPFDSWSSCTHKPRELLYMLAIIRHGKYCSYQISLEYRLNHFQVTYAHSGEFNESTGENIQKIWEIERIAILSEEQHRLSEYAKGKYEPTVDSISVRALSDYEKAER